MAPLRYDAEKVDPSPLGQPLHFPFSNRSAANRFLKGAMTERLSSWSPTDLSARGIPSPELINLYNRWGEGGIGLILTGNIMVDPDHLEAAGNPIIPRNAPFSGPRFEAFAEMARVGKKEGSLMVGQVSHPGRQVVTRIQSDPVSASDVKLEKILGPGYEFNKPHAASKEEIDGIVEGFAHAAEYLEKAGYDGIELHGAHGYLLAQFLSLTTNKRTDSYGGSLLNRARLILEIETAIRARVSPSFILGIKLNSVEFQAHGFQPAEARELCSLLEEHRFDFVELSGGTYEELSFDSKESTKQREAFFMEFADRIVPALKQTKSYVTGGFRTVAKMVEALGTVDGIGLARPLCQEPRLCKDILSGKVNAAIRILVGENNFSLNSIVAGTQIRMIGQDREPFDGSDEKQIEGFMKDMAVWLEEMTKDDKFEKYGNPEIRNLPAVPYGAVKESALLA